MLFCICPDITIQLGVWEAFHSSAALLLAQEAFRSEVLAPGTAAAGFPRFMVTGAGDPRVAPVAGQAEADLCICYFRNLNLAARKWASSSWLIFTPSKETVPKSWDGKANGP